MKGKKVTLLDRARADLRTAKFMLKNAVDETDIDISAYHCHQCVEKVLKYMADLKGQDYTRRHELYIITDDVDIPEITLIIEPYISLLDTWISSVRYASSVKSNRKKVEEVVVICEKIVAIAESSTPEKVNDPTNLKKITDNIVESEKDN